MTDLEKINACRYDKLAFLLNYEAYKIQLKANKSKPLKHFIPCNKALILTAALNKEPIPVTQEVIPEAGRTNCPCHINVNENDLYKMFFFITR